MAQARRLSQSVAALAIAAALAAPALAEPFSVETFTPTGIALGETLLYDNRRALIVTAEDSRTSATERGELAAWLDASGFVRTGLDAEAADFRAALTNWLRGNDLSERTQLLIVIDAPLVREGGAESFEITLGGRRESVDLGSVLLTLNAEAEAAHVVVALSASPRERYGGRVITTDTPLANDVGAQARMLLAPTTTSERTLAQLARGLRGDLGASFDSDAFISLADLVRASDGLDLMRFGEGSGGGMPVLSRRQSYERPVLGESADPRAAYERVRLAIEPEQLRTYLTALPEDAPDAAWARIRLTALEDERRRESGRECDRALAFEPELILNLGLAVTSEIHAFEALSDLAARWLSAVGRASALDSAMAAQVLEECRRAGPAPPERRLAMALAAAGVERGQALPELLAPLLDTEATRDETIVEGATLLGALALAARDPRRAAPVPPAFEARVRDELSALAADNRAALLLSGLLSLQERTGEAGRREGLAAIAAAAEAGMPLAQGLYGVLMLSEAFNVERLRVGLTPDPDRAMALLTAARRRGLALGPDTVALDTLEKRRRAQFVAHCQSRLDFDLRALLDPWNLRAGADVAEGLGRLPTLLRRALDGASLEGWRQACAEIDALDDVPGDLLLALAAMRARAGETDMAEALLARVEPDPFVAFVRASLLYGRDESEAMVRLSAAAREGHEGATLYLALLGSGRTEETERLRAEVRTLAEAGLPAAQFLQAVFEQRAREPFAAIRALVWAERAEAAGFTIGPRMLGQIRSTAAAVLERDLGFRLEALTPESRRRHGHTTYRGRGVLVAEIGEEGTAATGRSPLARGMIVDEVNRTALDSTVTTARRLMLEQLMESGRISGFVTRPGGGKALYLLQPPADLAAFLEERPESLGLRVLNSRPSTLRQGPGEAFSVLTDTRAGERVQLLSPLEGGWVRVRLTRDNALEGYLPHVAFAHN